MRRRQLLATVGATGVGGLPGCLSVDLHQTPSPSPTAPTPERLHIENFWEAEVTAAIAITASGTLVFEETLTLAAGSEWSEPDLLRAGPTYTVTVEIDGGGTFERSLPTSEHGFVSILVNINSPTEVAINILYP